MALGDDIVAVHGTGNPPVKAEDSMGYSYDGSQVVAFDFSTGAFFLADGGRAQWLDVAQKGLQPRKTSQSFLFPSLGKYATCWLGDCIITSLTGRRAVIRTTCGKYAVAPHLLRPLCKEQTVYGVRVMYGDDRCAVFPSITCSGGAAALAEHIVGKLASTGLVIHGDPAVMELQCVDGPAVAFRHISTQSRLLLRLRARISGQCTNLNGFHDVPADIATAHVVIDDYLDANPWAFPISHDLLRARLSIFCRLDTHLIFTPHLSVDDVLYLKAPQRTFGSTCWEVDAEQIVLGVRAGRIEAQANGTFAVQVGHGSWGQVKPRNGVCLQKLMWQIDDVYDACLPLGNHKIDLPYCPDCLLLERFGGDGYDPVTKTVISVL